MQTPSFQHYQKFSWDFLNQRHGVSRPIRADSRPFRANSRLKCFRLNFKFSPSWGFVKSLLGHVAGCISHTYFTFHPMELQPVLCCQRIQIMNCCFIFGHLTGKMSIIGQVPATNDNLIESLTIPVTVIECNRISYYNVCINHRFSPQADFQPECWFRLISSLRLKLWPEYTLYINIYKKYWPKSIFGV